MIEVYIQDFKFYCYRFSSSIFVAGAIVPRAQAFKQLLYNPQCFLVLESNRKLPPSEWGQVQITNCYNINFILLVYRLVSI